MTFTTNFFLVGFLPGFILLYYVFYKKLRVRQCLLLIANLLFYIWGGIEGLLFLLSFCLLTWILLKICYKCKSKTLFGISCAILLVPLAAVKYSGLILTKVDILCNLDAELRRLIVPIGLSFFTFEAISCLCDLYRGNISQPLTLWEVFLYLSFFPTVVSGPIVRITNFREGWNTQLTVDAFSEGIQRFVVGLSKKVLVADKISVLANYYFDGVAAGHSYSILGLWIGSFAYTIQLYFDFSGYSDMAIGIAKILGFTLPENFNHPYQAKSIQDFWRRWHISLSSWFRDYIYIPLGGSKCGSAIKHIRNMLFVWLLTGIWHGADWTFIIWGLSYFILLIMEKYIPFMRHIGNKWYGNIYTIFWVNLLWIPFRANNLSTAVRYVLGMFGMNSFDVAFEERALRFLPFLIFSILLCLPWKTIIEKYIGSNCYKKVRTFALLILTVISICAVVNASYTPYIYGNF